MSLLPIASPAAVRRHAARLARRFRTDIAKMLALYAGASAAALVGPWVVGQFVEHALHHTLTTSVISHLTLTLVLSSLCNTALNYFARRRSYVLGERVFATLREEFLASVLRLPLITVERAGTGDLLSRTTNDVEALNRTVRFALPEWTVAIVQTVLTGVAMLIAGPLVALAGLVALPLLTLSTRRYLTYAGPGYTRERIAYASLFGSISEAAEGARTIDALRLNHRQRKRVESHINETFLSEMYTLSMRLWWFPITEANFAFSVATTLVWGGWLYVHGYVSVAAATAVTLYVVQLTDPLDRIVAWLDELQIGQVALARLIGVADVTDSRDQVTSTPSGERIVIDDVRYAYRDNHDVLHGVSLTIEPGERLAIVGPSGAGKSTLGRLIAGIDVPREGSITVGGVSVAQLPLTEIRTHVALVTQEHHLFIGSLRDNLRLADPAASDTQLLDALEAVDAREWAELLPDGLATEIGTSGYAITPAQAQQIALARLVLADPHTLVLDEATAMLDPRAARHLERSLAAVLSGRTVIAIAHRLHTAHDADRVAVVIDGRIAELGTHDELLRHNGEYATLWRSWRSESPANS
ncbi:MAG: ABC transporter ATP-binding protein/permease [Acidobacteria bacterium]|nr:ABC transporter ATP-binding protein/permease [Acidobacteriota bacterium]